MMDDFDRYALGVLGLLVALCVWACAGTIAAGVYKGQRDRTCAHALAGLSPAVQQAVRDSIPWCPKEAQP